MMKRLGGFVLLCGLLAACKNGEKVQEKKVEAGTQVFAGVFKEGKLPYQLTDTGLLKNMDTTSVPAASISPLIHDSITDKYFGRKASIKYTSLVKLSQKEKAGYYIVKAASGSKKAALLLVFDTEENFSAAYPFLVPDEDPNTSQTSSIDKNFTITKSTTQKSGADIIGEGKEVVAYDAAARNFSLIMMDALKDNTGEGINPIDTFPKTNSLAGDYYLAKNIVAVRDGRYPNQLLVYIHTENTEGDCKGELKGEFLLTSATTASYRLGGDPCVLGLSFKGNSVSIKEESGCGNHRGLDCPLSGTFTRKKAMTSKQTPKKPKRK
jgi:hypothetical protein